MFTHLFWTLVLKPNKIHIWTWKRLIYTWYNFLLNLIDWLNDCLDNGKLKKKFPFIDIYSNWKIFKKKHIHILIKSFFHSSKICVHLLNFILSSIYTYYTYIITYNIIHMYSQHKSSYLERFRFEFKAFTPDICRYSDLNILWFINNRRFIVLKLFKQINRYCKIHINLDSQRLFRSQKTGTKFWH